MQNFFLCSLSKLYTLTILRRSLWWKKFHECKMNSNYFLHVHKYWLSNSFLIMPKGGEVFGWLHCSILLSKCFQNYIFSILLSFKENSYFYAINVCHHKKWGECWIKDSIQGFHCCCFDDSKYWVKNNMDIFLFYVKNIFTVEKLLSRFYLG